MRTVDDLREALLSLESEAPAVEELLVTSSRAVHPVDRSARRIVLPAVAAGLTVAVVLAVAGVVASRSRSGATSAASQTATRAAVGGQGRQLPFRLTSSLPQLTLLDVHSQITPAASYGTAVVAEYGMEVTIDVRTARGGSPRSASASPTRVGGVAGWIDVSCGVRAAPSSVAPVGGPASTAAAPAFDPTCSLSYESGPWQVAIYVAGPGGGSRTITAEQFLQIGDRLRLAASLSDASTWFAAHELLPS